MYLIKSKQKMGFGPMSVNKRPINAEKSNELIYTYWMDCCTFPYPSLLMPYSVGKCRSVVFESAPFQDRKLHVLSRVIFSSEVFRNRGNSTILEFIYREFIFTNSCSEHPTCFNYIVFAPFFCK